jgi:hypothetical protein
LTLVIGSSLELRINGELTSLDEGGSLYEGNFAWTFIDPRIANRLMKKDYIGYSGDEGGDMFIRTVLQFQVRADFTVSEAELKKLEKQYLRRAYLVYNDREQVTTK